MSGFFLTEDYDDPCEPVERDVHGDTLAIPAADRRPNEPGFVLTWREYPPGGGEPVERTGMVLSLAPPAKSVWVVPDEPRPGDGYAVLVREVTRDDATAARRDVGGPGDYVSTEAWQSPRGLPRALLRVDQVAATDGEPRTVASLHSRADCTYPLRLGSVTVERGEPVEVDTCYVFDGHLHPASARPLVPGRAGNTHEDGVQPCGSCLLPGRP